MIDDDVGWLRDKGRLNVMVRELEAFAMKSLGDPSAAIASYEKAAEALKHAKFYTSDMVLRGREEFEDVMKSAAWRNFKLANYNEQVGDLYQSIGRPEEAAAAYAAAKKLIEDTYGLPDLTPQSRALLDQFSTQPPDQRCAAESQFKGVGGLQPTQVTFANQYSSSVRLYRLDDSGQRKLFATIDQGSEVTQRTFVNDPWLIADLADKCLAIYLPEIGASQFTVH
jgi:tetratricopeptide (TPR) repeat protein